MWQKIELYIISLWLLFLLLFINKVQIPLCFKSNCQFIGIKELLRLNVVPTISFIFILLAAIFYYRFDYKIVKSAPSLPRKADKVQSLNFETLSFLVTYIIPLLSFDLGFNLDKDRNLLMLFLVLFFMGWIYIKTDYYYTNPTLALLGYKIYKIDTLELKDITVILKGKLKQGDNIYPKKIDDNIYFISKSS